MLWDLLFVTLAKSVSAAAQPVLRWRARTEAPRQRARIDSMEVVAILDAAPGARVRIHGLVTPLPSRTGALVVRDASGAALVHPASAAGIWASDGTPLDAPAAGETVDVVGVPRLAELTIDRELADVRDARLVFAGSERAPLFILRR